MARHHCALLLAACVATACAAGASAAVGASDEAVYSATEALPFCEGPQWELLGQDVPGEALNATLAAFNEEFAPDGANPYADTEKPWVPCDDSDLVAVAEGCRQEQEDGELYQLHVIAGCANSNVEFFADLVLSATNVTATFSQVLAL